MTFDDRLRYQQVDRFCLTPDDQAMTSYDNPMAFDEGADTIVELKCSTRVPLWMIDLIRAFDLERSSFSKYRSSLLEMSSLQQPGLVGRLPAVPF